MTATFSYSKSSQDIAIKSFCLKHNACALEFLSTPAAAAEWSDRARSLLQLALVLVFGAPGFWTRFLPFQVLSAFMIHYVQLALSTLCAPFKGEALLCWTFFSVDSNLIAT